MKIEKIETTSLALPFKKIFVAATNRFVTATGLLVNVALDDGAEGYGYADLFPRTGESPESARAAIESVLRPALMGEDLREWVRLRKKIEEPACSALSFARRAFPRRNQDHQDGRRR